MKTMNKFELLAYARDAVKVKLDEYTAKAEETEKEFGINDSVARYWADKYQEQYNEILELLMDAFFNPEN